MMLDNARFKNSPLGLIPDDWEVESLGNIAFITKLAGFEYSDYFDYEQKGEIIALRVLNIRQGKLVLDDIQTIPRRISLLLPRSALTRGDLVMSYVGTIGEVALIHQSDLFHLAPNVAKISPNVSILPKFLLYYLLQEETQKRIYDLSTITSQPALSMGRLRQLYTIAPPLPEQEKIAEILDTIDRTISATERAIEKLKQIKTGLVHDLLTRGIDENGQLRDPVQHPEQFKDSPLGLIPKEWEISRLDAISEIVSGVALGRTLYGSNTIELPYLRVANVQDGYLDLSEIKKLRILKNELSRYCLQKGDVLMNEGGDYDKLGRGAVWNADISPCIHQNHVFRVRPDRNKIISIFLSLVSGSNYGKNYFVKSSKQTTNLASINSSQLKSFPIPLPTIQEQTLILKSFDMHDKLLKKEQAHLEKLKLQKKGLMNDLLTGKVRVNHLL